MNTSAIEWTDRTWNPVSGCSHVSEGCRNCYAERFFPRAYASRKFTNVQCHPERLDQPLKIKKPQKIFVNSMSDLFHEDVPDEFIDQVFAVMADSGKHTFQILTKRPRRMMEYMSPDNYRYSARKVFDLTNGPGGKFDCDIYWPLDNVWLGISVEDQKTADERIPLLLQTPAAVRWISAEPLLGPIDLTDIVIPDPRHAAEDHIDALFCDVDPEDDEFGGVTVNWVVVGGESGPKARPMHPAWVRSIRDQCQSAAVPFFFKQWGEWASAAELHRSGVVAGHQLHSFPWGLCNPEMVKIGKTYAGQFLDGCEWQEFPKTR